nr:site-specific integrase [Deltaproteobacteria bacterium]
MHDCRRTFATELHRSGQPLTLVRDRMGHGDVETTEGYLGRYRSDRDRVVPDMGVGAALLGAAPAPTPDRKSR